ncbi:MAG: DUF4349 domain-containing protein [Chthoniobacterales bacterium]
MATTHDIHNDIESWLAAAVHEQLTPEERAALDEHLAACASCRALHAEEEAMHHMIENTLSHARPDLAFEQRIVSRFRRQVPERLGITAAFGHFFRWRATQMAAAAAVLLTLVQVGRVVTNEGSFESAAMGPKHSRPSIIPSERKENASGGALMDQRRAKSAPAPQSMASFAGGATGSANAPKVAAPPPPTQATDAATTERIVTTGSYVSAPESEPAAAPEGETVAAAVPDNRKLIRNAQVELEVVKFDEAVQRITAFAAEDRGWIATSSSQKQANGKLRGEVVAKVLPENLDQFLLKLRGLGELKNQTLGTDDVTKQYFDTDSRLTNARVMEQRLIDILKTKSNKVADLLEVEKELGRVRQQIEEMQGALKYMDAQVQFATVTITLAEKDLDEPAAFLLKRRARLALFSTDVEKTFAEVKSVIEGAKAQLSSSTLDRDSSGEATARLVLLIVPEEADVLIERVKGMGRVQNYTEQTDRVAQGGSGMSQSAKVEHDKVELSVTISRNEQEPALQTTSLRILTSAVSEKTARLKANAAQANAEIRSSSFSRDPNGQEIANVTLRVAMKNYAALMSSFDQLGKVKDVSVQREDRRGIVNEETAPADISIQVYSQPDIVSDETGLFATIRHTLAQGAAALMWSLRMIGVALAFLAPWALAVGLVIWGLRKLARRRAAKPE